MNLDIDEEMIASGETQPTDWIRLRLLPIPRTQHSETISGNHSLVIIFAITPPAPPSLGGRRSSSSSTFLTLTQ
jgi:hypothetical protein